MKKNNSVSPIAVVCALLLFTSLMIYGSIYIINKVPSTTEYFSKYNRTIKNELNDLISEQKEIDNKIDDIIYKGGYSFEEPCVLTNPYKINSLSALIIFDTIESTSITIKINDEEITTMEKSKKHVIPIYSLVSNKINKIVLTNDFNETKEIEIKTDIYDNYLSDFDMESYLVENNNLAMISLNNKEKNNIRVFNKNKELVSFLSLGNIKGINFRDDKYEILYKSYDNDSLGDIRVDVDLLGKILSVTNPQEDYKINKNGSLNIESDTFVSRRFNLYKNNTLNYQVKNVTKKVSKTLPIYLSTTSLSDKLIESKSFTDEFKITTNSNYLTFEFKTEVDKLLLVEADSKYTYSYDIKDINEIAISKSNKYALYVIKDDTYYNLLTTIEI